MTEIIYRTIIRNERKTGVVLWERTGQGMGFVAPGTFETLETWNADTPYAQFEEIVYKNDAIIELKENPLWPKPQGKWICTVLNRDGRAMERRIIAGREMVLLKGIPRQVATPCDDPWAIYCKMEIQEVQERKPSTFFADYNEFNWILKDVFTDRSEAELQELEIELKKLTTDIEDVEHV
jgi:hypothetical protein